MNVRTLHIIFILFLFPLSLMAENRIWEPKDLPITHLQDSTKWVCNPDNVLSSEAVHQMDSILSSLHQRKGVEAIIAVVKRLSEGDCYEFGMELGRIHKVGKKSTQSGLIVVLSTEDRAYYILPGRGLEGVLPDAVCKRVERNIMVPYLKEAAWDSAMVCTLRELGRYIETEEMLNNPDDDETIGLGGLLLFLLGIFILPTSLACYFCRKKCPNCKKRGMKPTSRVLIKDKRTAKIYKVTYTCPRCQHKVTETVTENKDNFNNGSGGAIAGGLGSSGGGFSGGGFSGGSFGGGGFSGGGAGGRF